jgi:hypothetical protein
MSDTNNQSVAIGKGALASDATAVAVGETAAAEEGESSVDFAAEAAKWKELARKNEARAKENSDKAKRFDEIEEASRSDLEKAQARIDELERASAEANAARIRSDIARTKGVPVELLTGSDEDSLTAQADALLAFKGTQATAPSSEGQGKRGEPVGSGVKQLTRDEFARLTPEQKIAARDSGALARLLEG